MLSIKLEGIDLSIEYLLLDYTGTISEHGRVLEGVQEKIEHLREKFKKIVVLTADTFKSVTKQLEDFEVEVVIFNEKTGKAKLEYMKKLGCDKCAAVGNGNNDIEMLQKAALSIAVINKDGCNANLIRNADLVFRSTYDALDALIDERILISLLRD